MKNTLESQISTEPSSIDTVYIYTDGGCSGNPGRGAWAFYVPLEEHYQSGKEEETTNNRMELLACINALRWLGLEKRKVPVFLYTDSQYVQKGITVWIASWIRNNWMTKAKKKVLNRDLWEILFELQNKNEITWNWVRGHDNNEYNEFCDKLVKRELGLVKL